MAVADSWFKSAGARMVGDGDGREVRYGFCARAAERVACDSGGVTRVMSGFGDCVKLNPGKINRRVHWVKGHNKRDE